MSYLKFTLCVVILLVSLLPAIRGMDAVQLEPLVNKEVRVGRVAAFLCTLYQGDKVQFTWSKDGTLLRSSGRIQIHSTAASSMITIQRVDPYDAGNYTCIGSNSLSEERTSAHLIVEGIFHFKPIFG
ncbi:transmembrane and immunoglobulin domain-containing protein 1-like [Varroa jacobsoni]|uniref:transmembrane and immunoglobulin domain-containing protein 1-like n=1 Tax=Varroa jacobsoni TaxID=62625 RepID=UPI000BF47405|nr:transmembrane and immunoglobulin domain-containing protein 1-like [Varroa jacobsoni]